MKEHVRVTYVIYDSRIFVFVCSGEGYTFWERNRSVPHNLDLYTVGVELGTAAGILLVRDFAFMEANHFGADEVAGKC